MSDGGLDRLLAISYAVARREKSGRPIEGAFLRAQKYTAQCCRSTPCGSRTAVWVRSFLPAGAASPDAAALRSSGRAPGMARPIIAGGKAHRSPRRHCGRIGARPGWRPALPVERGVAIDAGDCLARTRPARAGDLRPAGVCPVQRRPEAAGRRSRGQARSSHLAEGDGR